MRRERISRRELSVRLEVNYNVLCSVLAGSRKMSTAMEQRIKLLMLTPLSDDKELIDLVARLEKVAATVQTSTSEMIDLARKIRLRINP